jgi:hypothetical protein
MECGIIIVFILLILLISKGKYKLLEFMDTRKIRSSLDNRNYSVSKSFSDIDKAAETLSKLHAFICNFLDFLKKNYINNPNNPKDKKQFIQRILYKYNPDTLYENNPYNGGETSFVINKGASFGVCLREKITNTPDKIHNFNTLQFVVLHEITHIGTISYGHNNEFWSRFKFILSEAYKSGLYTPINYTLLPSNYCGLTITSNPLFDNTLVY